MQAHKNATPLGIHTRRRVASPRCGAARPHLKRANKSYVTPGTSLRRSSPLKSVPYSRTRDAAPERIIRGGMHTVACASEQASHAPCRDQKPQQHCPFVVFMPRGLWSSNSGKWHGRVTARIAAVTSVKRDVAQAQLLRRNAGIISASTIRLDNARISSLKLSLYSNKSDEISLFVFPLRLP